MSVVRPSAFFYCIFLIKWVSGTNTDGRTNYIYAHLPVRVRCPCPFIKQFLTMKTPSEIKELKQISIVEYLASKGINPVSKSGQYFMYHSPLREDSKPSFGVNHIKNTFYDLGNPDDQGNIIELVMKFEGLGFRDACKFLESGDLVKENENLKTPFLLPSQTPLESSVGYQIVEVKDVEHPALNRYVNNRKISVQTAFNYLQEIHYTNAKGKFFGVGYQMDNGSYVVRSEIMKKPINLGKAGIKTFAVPDSKNLSLFEGMFDFLSACEYYKGCPSCTAIVLNSTSNLNNALPTISQYKKVFCYLDNDDAGRKALDKLRKANVEVIDKSSIYQDFNDFNEFSTNTQK